MVRRADWEKRLDATIQQALRTPFVWGTHDCALFACDCLAAMTDTDPAKELRGAYTDEPSARKAIRKFAGAKSKLPEIVSKIAAQHQLAEVAPLMARRGDVVLVKTDNGPALGIVALDGCTVVMVSQEGLVRMALRNAIRAWRIN